MKKYIISSSSLNAWGIIEGLRRCGIPRDAIFYQTGSNDMCYREAQPIDDFYQEFDENCVLFFTDEDSLQYHLQRSQRAAFYPHQAIPLFFNKLEFFRFVQSIGEHVVPSAPTAEDLRYTGLGFPLVLKPRYSWKEGNRLPRGMLIRNTDDLEKTQSYATDQSLSIDDFFYQKYLGADCTRNISVSGWHSTETAESFAIVTQKLYQKTALGIGFIVGVIEDPAALTTRTRKILDAMQYEGPFEMEFFYDAGSMIYDVLEFNPRFWMQHSIFLECFDNCVIKRYLGLPASMPRRSDPIIWMDSMRIIRKILLHVDLHLFFNGLGYYTGGRTVLLVPRFFTAVRLLLERVGPKIKKTLRRTGSR